MRSTFTQPAVRVLLRRLRERHGRPAPEEMVGILYMLTSFETFDGLAGEEHVLESVAPS